MGGRLDTPERRDAIRGSAEVSAAKHLARAYGVSMRRSWAVGVVVFDIGLTSSVSVATGSRTHGSLEFDDTGRITYGQLFGTPMAGLTIPQLASLLEHGPQPEVTTTIVLTEAPEAITAPIPIVRPLEDEPAVVVRPVVPRPRGRIAPPGRKIVSVPVPLVAAVSAPRRRPTLAERQARVLAELGPAWRLWVRFWFGLVLLLVTLGVGFALYLGVAIPGAAVALSVVPGMIGLALLRSAIRANDERLDELRAVGL